MKRSASLFMVSSLALLVMIFAMGAEQAADGDYPSAEDVLKEMLKHRAKKPSIAPTQTQVVEAPAPVFPRSPGSTSSPIRSGPLDVDSRILGTAPGAAKPTLKREGEFVTLRRGRLMRSPSANQVMFVFAADQHLSPEPPMVIMPCQALENMERVVAERGDHVVFQLAGQVFAYRGTNYLLPSIWRLPADRGNMLN